VVRVALRRRRPGGGRDAGDAPELADEVGRIGVARGGGDLRPGRTRHGGPVAEDALEAQDACEGGGGGDDRAERGVAGDALLHRAEYRRRAPGPHASTGGGTRPAVQVAPAEARVTQATATHSPGSRR